MLTSELAINWRRGDRVYPFLVKANKADYLRDAENLIRIFEEFAGKTRGELEGELEDYIGNGTDYRVLRGLIKLLTDRSEFAAASNTEPSEIRQKVFLEARRFHPALPDSAARIEILSKASAELNADAGTIFSNLYADLSAQQKLISFREISAAELLDRYNLAQAQALLYKCVEMKIRVAPSSLENYRAIFGFIKHFGLIHAVRGNYADGYEVILTGAASLFHRSQKYGVQMAVFLPALLLCKDWKFSAEISQKQGGNVFYQLEASQTELNSCYWDEPEYKNPDIEKLKKTWDKSSLGWKLAENKAVIDLGKTAFIPDLILVSPAENEKIYVEVSGFWTPKNLRKRLEEFEAANFKNFIIAASHELRGSRDEPLWTSENVVFYKTKIESRLLVETAERIIQTNRA